MVGMLNLTVLLYSERQFSSIKEVPYQLLLVQVLTYTNGGGRDFFLDYSTANSNLRCDKVFSLKIFASTIL